MSKAGRRLYAACRSHHGSGAWLQHPKDWMPDPASRAELLVSISRLGNRASSVDIFWPHKTITGVDTHLSHQAKDTRGTTLERDPGRLPGLPFRPILLLSGESQAPWIVFRGAPCRVDQAAT